jgi:Tol biopolymer transport system component
MIGVYDFVGQTNCQAVNGTSGNASLSADGRWLAFEGKASSFGTNSGNTVSDIFLLDRASNTVRLASFNSNRIGGNGPSSDPIMSADGRYLVFKSKAADLVAGDTNGVSDIFVEDLSSGSLFALSCAANGAIANRVSGNAIIGPDGRTLVFESFASNLAPGDLNESKDVFVLRLPADSTAEFRILTLTSLGTGTASLFWNSVPGKTYRVEFSESLSNPNWAELPGDVVATGYISTTRDDAAPSGNSRFYRVRLLD